MYQDDLVKLSKEELIALALAQTAQIEELTRRIADLEAKRGGPPKTPANSSLPPSQGRKPNRAERRGAKKRKGRLGVFRALAANPDRIVASVAERCPHCDHALTLADQSGFHAYDHIELPPIRPVITRMHRHRGVCPSCRRGFSAPPPAGMPPASPFGPELVALILHLHVTQAIGFERLVRLLDEVFAIRISEGAIANMLARAGTPLAAAAETVAAEVRSSKVVASDETSARVEGKNWWQWVLLSSTAVHHLIADSRGADRFPWRDQARCLGCRPLRRSSRAWKRAPAMPRPPAARCPIRHRHRRHRLRSGLLQAAAARRCHWSPPSRSQGHHPGPVPCRPQPSLGQALDRRLDRLLAVSPTTQAGQQLARGIRKCRGDLFVFITRRDVPATNNECERALRPSVIFRKVTGGFRSQWGARTYADALSVIATGRLHGHSALNALRDALAGRPILVPP